MPKCLKCYCGALGTGPRDPHEQFFGDAYPRLRIPGGIAVRQGQGQGDRSAAERWWAEAVAVPDANGCAIPAPRLRPWLEPSRLPSTGIDSVRQFQRPRRQPSSHHHHQAELDSGFLHLPKAALTNFPDGDQACEALKNASLLQQVLPVVVEQPCPVKLNSVVDPRRVWPAELLAAECACLGSSCRSRTAFVCTQLVAPVVVVTVDDAGQYNQHRQLVPSGCRCMSARATMPIDDDVK
ncbi:uncharacterized protein LOC117641221 [Thrips palmi]|uniref:Uncharacterized protein LOC117641221 n=1 Tax=Thrips palmi TaxID=161013 RepID=A0A6P8ZIV5_THRPL|nr:uncharacterized protein LOC117641221 [Thrips palmi]